MNTINQYSNEIKDIAQYAAKVGFNPETDCFDTFMQKWLEMGRKRHEVVMNDKSQAIKIIK